MLKPNLHPEAVKELAEAARFYEQNETGLGNEFLEEFATGVRSILRDPRRSPVREFGFRKFGLRRFPYSIRYIEREENLYIVAVPHSSREPGYWKKRTSDEQR